MEKAQVQNTTTVPASSKRMGNYGDGGAKSIQIDQWSRKSHSPKNVLNRSLYLMMVPYLLLFSLFTVVPVVMSFALGFTYFNILETPKWVGWNNYLDLFLNDPIFIIAVKNLDYSPDNRADRVHVIVRRRLAY